MQRTYAGKAVNVHNATFLYALGGAAYVAGPPRLQKDRCAEDPAFYFERGAGVAFVVKGLRDQYPPKGALRFHIRAADIALDPA